jgi:hypothetical protein
MIRRNSFFWRYIRKQPALVFEFAPHPSPAQPIRDTQKGNHKSQCAASDFFSRLLGGIVGCTGAVVIVSEKSDRQAALVLKLWTEAGDEVLLPLSERSAKQVQMVIGEFNRGRDFLVVED